MPVSQLVTDTPFCSTIKRDGLLTYLLNKQGSNIPVDNNLSILIQTDNQIHFKFKHIKIYI